jgi:hypothetical protein
MRAFILESLSAVRQLARSFVKVVKKAKKIGDD